MAYFQRTSYPFVGDWMLLLQIHLQGCQASICFCFFLPFFIALVVDVSS